MIGPLLTLRVTRFPALTSVPARGRWEITMILVDIRGVLDLDIRVQLLALQVDERIKHVLALEVGHESFRLAPNGNGESDDPDDEHQPDDANEEEDVELEAANLGRVVCVRRDLADELSHPLVSALEPLSAHSR